MDAEVRICQLMARFIQHCQGPIDKPQTDLPALALARQAVRAMVHDTVHDSARDALLAAVAEAADQEEEAVDEFLQPLEDELLDGVWTDLTLAV